MKKAIVAGSLVLDITPIAGRSEGLNLVGGKQTYLDDVGMNLGGCVGNTGIALSRLGIPVHLVSRIGDDDIGWITRQFINRCGCEHTLLENKGDKTSCSVILLPKGNNRIILHKKGAAQELSEKDLPDSLFTGISLFHLGYPPNLNNLWKERGQELATLLGRISRMGVVTSLDMCSINYDANTPASCQETLTNVLRYCDIFAPSAEEIFSVYYPQLPEPDPSRFPELADRLIEAGCAVVLIKAGNRGMYLKTAGIERMRRLSPLLDDGKQLETWCDREFCFPAIEVEHIMSTTGAGDVAIAGFLAALLIDERLSPEQVLCFASETAAVSLGSRDATSLIPDYKSILETINQKRNDNVYHNQRYSGCCC